MNRRIQTRRQADREFLLVIVGGVRLTFLIGVSVGYFWAAKTASQMMIEDARGSNSSHVE